MQAGKVCVTLPGIGAPLRMRNPAGRGSKVRRSPPPTASTTHNSRHAERLASSALRLRAALHSRCSLGLVVRGGWGCRLLTLVERAGRCGVAVLSRFTCLSLSLLPGFPDVVPCLPLPYIPRAVSWPVGPRGSNC